MLSPAIDVSTDLSLLLMSAVSAALIGGLHCSGMCGGLASLAQTKSLAFVQQLGRLISYLILGVVAAYTGQKFLSLIPKDAQLITIGIVFLMSVWLLLSSVKLPFVFTLQKWLWKLRPKTQDHSSYFTLGLLNGLLPCGWLYAFLLLAAGSGDILRGMILMFALWLGSAPWLLGFSLAARKLRGFSKHSVWLNIAIFVFVAAGLLSHVFHDHSDHEGHSVESSGEESDHEHHHHH